MTSPLWGLRLQMMETDLRLGANAKGDLTADLTDFLRAVNVFISDLLQSSTDLEWSALTLFSL